MRVLLPLLLVALVWPSALSARDAREQQRIDYLIQSLGALQGAFFIRNGTEYDASAAQSHLRQKLAYVGERVKTAENFIKYCASESSFTHKPYQIRFSDGKVVDTAVFFSGKLKEFDEKNR
jgi:hydrogenase maturation factor HypF (carbamoyltransferase family)